MFFCVGVEPTLGPSVYARVVTNSKTPLSGAVSFIGPNSGTLTLPLEWLLYAPEVTVLVLGVLAPAVAINL